MSAKLANRINSLRILTSLVGILGMGSLVSLPAFSQSNESPTDANTLPRGTVDAPAPNAGSNNNYPVNQSTPARTNQDGTMMTPECINQNENAAPGTTNLNNRNTEPDLNNRTAREITPTRPLQDCGTRMTPSSTNQDGTINPDPTNQDGTMMRPDSTNQDGTIAPDTNNEEGSSVGPGFNNSDDNVAPPGDTNAPDPNLEPRVDNSGEGRSR